MAAKKGKSIRQAVRLITRQAEPRDIAEIQAVMRNAYPTMAIYPADQLQGQMNNFPEGQFVAVYDGRVVGYCATFIADEADALSPHTWRSITGDGFASRHRPLGDWLATSNPRAMAAAAHSSPASTSAAIISHRRSGNPA